MLQKTDTDMEENSVPKFSLSVVHDTPNGWGPNTIPEQYRDMPYQPFSKGDRLGKVADWTGVSYQDRRNQSKYASQFGTGSSQYAYYHEDDESQFQLVDSTRIQKPIYARGRYMRNQRGFMRGMRGQQRNAFQAQPMMKGNKKQSRSTQPKWQRTSQQSSRRFDNRAQSTKNRESSVTVQPSWTVIEEIDFPRLGKLSLPNIKESGILYKCGELELYDKSYDRVNVKSEKKLQRIDRIVYRVTTSDDPIIRKLLKETDGNVFGTDLILSTLMCCTRSNYSWDIVVNKIQGRLFFDKRDASDLDLLTVSETSNDPPMEEGQHINSPHSLSLEATFINHNFSQQVLRQDAEKVKFENPNPFIAEEEDKDSVGSIAYKYKKWELGKGVNLIARTEHDAYMTSPTGEMQFINIKALNEWDSRFGGGVDWRQKLDSQRGAVLAQELKNNANKLAKWTVQSLLAGSDQMKFGYVSRRSVRDPGSHVVLGIQQFRPTDFANQINLNMDNAWGILRCIIDLCMKQDDGKFLIVKDPNKQLIRLYKVPDNSFDTEEDTDNDEYDEE
ncbi:eukaryotic translation initiation factor 3 subunit D-like [Artemia franciscana]|uniref:Eukaryotic translation initiation factor 3 subunit D n=1 Tax=Artemia franciscana TaxID=6661 RepID=A0AA88I2S3_ARTSF|nr:hypothetical protein QYM36_007317 [Artemia franciscana]